MPGVLFKNRVYQKMCMYYVLCTEYTTCNLILSFLFPRWHLGFCKWDYTPTYRGFDSFMGFYLGVQDYFTHESGSKFFFSFHTVLCSSFVPPYEKTNNDITKTCPYIYVA